MVLMMFGVIVCVASVLDYKNTQTKTQCNNVSCQNSTKPEELVEIYTRVTSGNTGKDETEEDASHNQNTYDSGVENENNGEFLSIFEIY